jgi:hypothetical protein
MARSWVGFPVALAMCKIGKRSFVAGAEIPKRYLPI